MNPIALWLASGESLYAGAGLLVLVAILSLWVRNKWQMRGRNLLAWVGLAMVLLASEPFAWGDLWGVRLLLRGLVCDLESGEDRDAAAENLSCEFGGRIGCVRQHYGCDGAPLSRVTSSFRIAAGSSGGDWRFDFGGD
jgi:hypothetical protein